MHAKREEKEFPAADRGLWVCVWWKMTRKASSFFLSFEPENIELSRYRRGGKAKILWLSKSDGSRQIASHLLSTHTLKTKNCYFVQPSRCRPFGMGKSGVCRRDIFCLIQQDLEGEKMVPRREGVQKAIQTPTIEKRGKSETHFLTYWNTRREMFTKFRFGPLWTKAFFRDILLAKNPFFSLSLASRRGLDQMFSSSDLRGEKREKRKKET